MRLHRQKSCAENRRTHTQPRRLPLVFVFVCVVFGNFVQFPSISVVHRFKTPWLSFTQLCLSIVRLFWAQKLTQITVSTSMTKLMQTRQGITRGGEIWTKKPPKQLICYSGSPGRWNTCVPSQVQLSRQHKCGFCIRTQMYQQHTGSPSKVADTVAACPQGVQPEPDLVASLSRRVSWSDVMSCSVRKAVML